jgi:hypothetical protein
MDGLVRTGAIVSFSYVGSLAAEKILQLSRQLLVEHYFGSTMHLQYILGGLLIARVCAWGKYEPR